jgi:colanic acid biosynthesis glycosyl transferase WcaI
MAVGPLTQGISVGRQTRILITSIFYAPEVTGIAPYTTGLAEHLAGRGFEVTVITGMPSYPQWRVHPEYRSRWYAQELLSGVDVRRVRSFIPQRQSILQRGLYESSFLFAAGFSTLTLRPPDAILGVVPSLGAGILARMAAQRFGRPYGLVFHDLTGPATTQSGIAAGCPAGCAAGWVSAAEGWAARNAAAIGVIAEGFRPYLESLRVDAQRIHRVRNWAHVEAPKLSRKTIRRHLDLPEESVICLHAGNMGLKQGLTNVVECARLAVETDPRLLFVLMGDGNERPRLVELVERNRLPNVRFLPIQPAELFSSVLAAADVLLINQRASVTNMSLPSKLTSYLSSSRPVVAALSPTSETAIEIRDTGTGLLVPPDQPGALLNTIRIVVNDTDLQQRLGRAAQAHVRTALSAGRALAGFESLLQAVMAPINGTQRRRA